MKTLANSESQCKSLVDEHLMNQQVAVSVIGVLTYLRDELVFACKTLMVEVRTEDPNSADALSSAVTHIISAFRLIESAFGIEPDNSVDRLVDKIVHNK